MVEENVPKEKDSSKLIRLHEKFVEYEEIKSIISSLPEIHNDLTATESKFDRFQFVINQYQEQPHLLDPRLEDLISSLLAYLRSRTSSQSVIHLACKLFYVITKTRGYKVIVRFLPHDVSDLEFVLAMLGSQSPNNVEIWETRYILLLWLSMVCMVPFEMSRLDGQLDGGNKKSIASRIIEETQQYLEVADKCRDASAYLLAKFLTRPDTSVTYLSAFINHCFTVMESLDCSSLLGQMKLCGYLSFLANVFKYGKRENLIDYVPNVLQRNNNLKINNLTNCLLQKLNVKLVQRLGLTLLKPKVAAWRYKRGMRSIADTLQMSNQTLSEAGTAAEISASDNIDDEDYDISDEVEDIIGNLLNGLQDRNTVVRWSAAKGVGRLASRLPRTLAGEVANSIINSFSETESNTAWHGGCLALAEMARRGLLLLASLAQVIQVIQKAILYDEQRGNFSVGAHVRDAASFVCWSLARAYDPNDLAPFVSDMASVLIIVTLFDREVMVRRAAAAAFQENVGRQGQFPHGIDILTTCDFFAVGVRKNCYLELSVFVASFPEYTQHLIDHLATSKSSHWDCEIRELCAQALEKLTPLAVDYVANTVLPQLLSRCRNADSNIRHGSIIAAGFVTHSLACVTSRESKSVKTLLGDQVMQELITLTTKFSKDLFGGLSGALMRKAVCCYMDKLLLSNIDISSHPDLIQQWQQFLNDCLIQRQDDVREAALQVLPKLVARYYTDKPDVTDQIITYYREGIKSAAEEMIRQGYCQALGCLPAFALLGQLKEVIDSLVQVSLLSPFSAKWALARRDAMKALGSVLLTVGKSKELSSSLFEDYVAVFFKTAFTALQDYETDNKGDVGAWVREAAMSTLYDVTSFLLGEKSNLLSSVLCARILGGLVQQACEKIDRTRALAGTLFSQLLYSDPELPYTHIKNLKELISRTTAEDCNWAVPVETFPLFVRLLSIDDFAYPVTVGFTMSTGGLTESVTKQSSSSLLSFLQQESDEVIPRYLTTLMEIYKNYKKVDRVTIPMLKQLDLLFNSGCLSSLPEPEGPLFVTATFGFCKEEIQKTTDPNKLIASISVFCDLLQFKSVQTRCLVQLSIFLCHKFPLVRRTAASKLYESLITLDEMVGEDDLSELLSLLGETDWSCPVPEVKPIRNKLCELLKIPVPIPVVKGQADG